MRLLCAALGAAFLVSTPPAAAEEEAAEAPPAQLQKAFDLLRGGGYALVMRHANSPHDQAASVGMTEGCNLQTGRGLDAEGFFQARQIGEWLKREAVPVLKAYTSDMCRSWDTARLSAGGAPVIPHGAQKTTDSAVIAAFKKEIEAELKANPGQNIMLVSHSNIAPFYGAKADADEEEVPSGAIYAVKPPKWRNAIRIDLIVDVGPQTVTVE